MPRIDVNDLPYDPSDLFNPIVEITQSRISDFLTCTQMYVFKQLMLLHPAGLNGPLTIGGAFHDGMEHLLDPELDIDRGDRLSGAVLRVHEAFDNAVDATDEILLGQEDKLEVWRAQAVACVQAWHITNNWRFESDHWVMLRAEENYRAKKKATANSPIADRRAGKQDGLLLDDNEDYMIIEHKTRSRLDTLQLVGLTLNLQALWYMLLSIDRPLSAKKREELGIVDKYPKGFIYNVVQKPQHRLNSKGFDDLVDRMTTAMINDPDKYMLQETVLLTEDVVDRADDNFNRIINAMDNLQPEQVCMNLTACENYNGCPYRALCQAGADASNPEEVLTIPHIDSFRIKEERSPELS